MSSVKTNYYEFTTEPSGEVVSLSFVKENARIDKCDDSEDNILYAYIDTALSRIEKITNRILRPAVINGFYPFARHSIYEVSLFVTMEKTPIRSINEVAIYNGTDFEALTLNDDYKIEKRAYDSRILFEPRIFDNYYNIDNIQPYSFRIGADVGYLNSDAVPPELKIAIAQYATWLYESRGDCSDCSSSIGGYIMPSSIIELISGLVVKRFFG